MSCVGKREWIQHLRSERGCSGYAYLIHQALTLENCGLDLRFQDLILPRR